MALVQAQPGKKYLEPNPHKLQYATSEPIEATIESQKIVITPGSLFRTVDHELKYGHVEISLPNIGGESLGGAPTLLFKVINCNDTTSYPLRLKVMKDRIEEMTSHHDKLEL